MQTVLVIVHLFLALGMVGLILMQHGKGADTGAAFGAGASGTVFGAAGSANLLSRTTAVLATLFFITSLALAWFSIQSGERPGLMDDVAETPEVAVPATPVAPESEVPAIPGAVQPAESAIPAINGADEETPKVAD